MSSPCIYLHYLQDILENAAKALEFVQDMSEDEFLKDDKTVFAVIRALEVMGEAASFCRGSEACNYQVTLPGYYCHHRN
jgi:uncharacterized protein with HEPN domain